MSVLIQDERQTDLEEWTGSPQGSPVLRRIQKNPIKVHVETLIPSNGLTHRAVLMKDGLAVATINGGSEDEVRCIASVVSFLMGPQGKGVDIPFLKEPPSIDHSATIVIRENRGGRWKPVRKRGRRAA